MLQYIRYFFYLAYNWNLTLAWHIIKNEIRGEKKFGINTTGADELGHLEKKGIDIEHSTIYMPAGYDVLDKIFTEAGVAGFNHFIDIGCGKGRALCVAAVMGAKKLTGLDLSKKLCDEAAANVEKIKTAHPGFACSIINNDAFYYEIPGDADCIFFFNPFDEMIMSAVVENIEKSLRQNPRKLTVIYLNPLVKHLFTRKGYKQVFHTKTMNYLEGIILEKQGGH